MTPGSARISRTSSTVNLRGIGHREVLAVDLLSEARTDSDRLQVSGLLDLRSYRALHSVANREHGDEGAHADDHAERRENRPQRIRAERLEADGKCVLQGERARVFESCVG